VELGHEVIFANLDLVDLDLFVLEFGGDTVDLAEDDTLVLPALG
jgi:hypothetical protein